MIRQFLVSSLAASVSFTAFAAQLFQPVPLEIGAAAPDFSLPGTDGKTYSLGDFASSNYLVVMFTSNHCPDARCSRERINQFAAEYKDKGVGFVAISGNDPKALQLWEYGYSVYGDTFEEMKSVAEEDNYPFPYLYDGDAQKASMAYGALATPHCFLFGPDRKLLYHGQFDNGRRNYGPAPRATLQENVDTVLAGGTIEKPVERCYGCSTKWSWKKKLADEKREEWEALPVTVAPILAEEVRALVENKTDKVRVINVWASYCGPCVAEFPELIDAYRRYQRRPFEFITISIDGKEDEAKVLKFLQSEHLPLAPHTVKQMAEEDRRATNNFHYQSDDLDALADALDTKWQGPIPHTIVVAPGGEILYRHTGHVDIVEMRRAVVHGIEKATGMVE